MYFKYAFDAQKFIIWQISLKIKCLLFCKERQFRLQIFMTIGCVMNFFGGSILVFSFDNS
jgi:hypothetical protein